MDFDVPQPTEELLGRIRAFLDQEVLPLEPALLAGRFAELEPLIEEKRRRVQELGLWAPPHPETLGGLGLGLVDYALVSEILGRSPLGHLVFGCQAPDAGNVEILNAHGSPEQKERWLRPLVAGEIRSCFAMTEPEMPGSNPVLLATTAVEDGDDYVLDGHKWFTTAADGAAFAVVMAVTEPDAPPHRRASMLIVPTDAPGFELVRNLPVMGEAGQGFFSHAEIRLSACRVPRSHRLGAAGHGFAIAQERLGPGRIHHCMRWLGIARRAFDLLCSRAAGRRIAPGATLADREIVQAWIADSAAEIAAARALTLEVAWKIERHGWASARRQVSMIKLLVAAAMLRVVDRALQVHGGLGMTDDTVLAFFYRHERAARIYDGPDEVHKLSLARQILKDYRRSG